MEELYYQTLKETLYHEKLDNGLEVYLLPKVGFEKTYGLFSTRFGSVDTTFIPLGENKMITVEDGVAHFLEHKMFDMKDGDAADKFALLGASSNAFTSSSRTAYLFSTTSHENECVELLLDFVQELAITDKSVEKEKGIIGQEIKMYDDDPDWRVYFGSIENLYQNHPVAKDIAGTVETVNRTTKEMLETCYKTFYHPNNMMLFVVGNIDPHVTMKLIIDNQNKKHFDLPQPIVRREIKEPLDIKTPLVEKTMDVEMSKIIVSIKVNEQLKTPLEKLKRELSLNILFDLLFSKSSKLYNEWLEKGIINDSFSANFTQERDYAFIQMGGDQDRYLELKDQIYDFIEHIKDIKFNLEDFERIKRKNIGNFINVYNSPEAIANLFSRYYFEGIISLDIVDIISTIQLEDIYSVMKYFDLKYTSTFIVKK
ncbi:MULTISPECIES: EF-P 5-aminopentanol modification-associated protein YfmH [Coprobacillaceae]|uniref:EF-P 5-aminopentanol modification-associated protein YfmH n=1 Tax=Coprobacillaceae TaxID=2810280 RepID=UPI000E541038|nr:MULTISPECIES: pitrilysin family protein [Coprobacillaceae]RHM63670.1 insulinase family protein [Coprobacillus sp. AF33-1AC]RHS96399.1 insulinase family protein [Erysipelatoclostridium sp. AM42-17]